MGCRKAAQSQSRGRVVKDRRRYFVTNALQLSSRAVKGHYHVRQQIELEHLPIAA